MLAASVKCLLHASKVKNSHLTLASARGRRPTRIAHLWEWYIPPVDTRWQHCSIGLGVRLTNEDSDVTDHIPHDSTAPAATKKGVVSGMPRSCPHDDVPAANASCRLHIRRDVKPRNIWKDGWKSGRIDWLATFQRAPLWFLLATQHFGTVRHKASPRI